mmetsp:Transcript_148698/g.258094  ORF Transcript_148698/g.258094 Transcript_148698/m.258094 type:complete len:253 (-) Transcript_148698:49-807(-)
MMTTDQIIHSFILQAAAPYLEAKDFVHIEITTKDARSLVERTAFSRCLAYGFPGIQANIVQKLLKELTRKQLVPVLTRFQRKVNHHFLAGGSCAHTFVNRLSFIKTRAGACAHIQAQTGIQKWTDCWVSSTVEFAVPSEAESRQFQMRLVLSNDLQKLAVAIKTESCHKDENLVVDIQAFENSVMILKTMDTSVKVNGPGMLGGMIYAKRTKDLANSLRSGLTCAIAVRDGLHANTRRDSHALHALQIDCKR